MPSHHDFIFRSIFVRFLLPTWTSESRKFEPPLQWEHDFLKIAFRCSHGFFVRFWSQLGSILPSQIHQKSDPKRHQNFDRFLLRFFLDSGSVLGTKLEPCWPPFSSQDAPRRTQDGQKTPQDAPKTPKDATRRPKTSPRRLQGAETFPRGRFWEDFWKILGRFLEDFFEEFAVQPASVNIRTQLQKSQNIHAALVALSGSSFAPQVWESKMEPSWHQNRIPNRSQLRKAIFWKIPFRS